jgi:hypothetical protein
LEANGLKETMIHKELRQMGLSSWGGGNMTTEGKWSQVFMGKCGFLMFFVAWGKSWFLKEFLGSFASSPRKTLGSNTPSSLDNLLQPIFLI